MIYQNSIFTIDFYQQYINITIIFMAACLVKTYYAGRTVCTLYLAFLMK